MGVKRGECLYGDEIISIASIYTIIDGKQINIPEELKKMRSYSDAKKLFCPCGCGENLILVAGENNLRTQHFRIYPGREQETKCSYQEESLLTIRSKIMLKCWLDSNLKASTFKYHVPISTVEEEESRKYEMSVYSPEYNIGIVYNRLNSGIKEEKLDILTKNTSANILFVSSKEIEVHNGQYPERMKQIQDRQGYCIFLDMNEDSEYNEVEMKISYYVQSYRGWWDILGIAYGMVDQFSLDADGTLLYEDIPVANLLEQKITAYEEEKQALKEKERLVQEETRRKEEEENKWYKERMRELEELQAWTAKEKEERIEQKKMNFLKSSPKTEIIYNLLSKATSIRGDFYSDQAKNRKVYRVTMNITKVKVNVDKQRLEIMDTMCNRAYFYIKEYSGQRWESRPGTGVSYQTLDYSDVPNEKIIEIFCNQFELQHKT